MAPAIAKPLLSDPVAQSGQVPPSHITPLGDRPDLGNVDHESGAGILLIDLKQLDGPERHKVVEAIGSACKTDGFFMVTNHGIPEAVVEGMLRVAREFFHLPESERLKCYSDDPNKAIRLSTSFNVRTEKVSNWCDFPRLYCYPLESFVDQWPSNPAAFRQVVGTYSMEARALALRLLEAISESLGLERGGGHMVTAMGRQAQHMAVNYYPPCPQPELTYGLPGHKDPNAITLLLQDGMSDLKVQRDGRWVAVNPVPSALVMNIGDQVQVFIDEAIGAKAGGPIAVGAEAAGVDTGDVRGCAGNLSTVVGIVAASSAVTAVATVTVCPVVAFVSFLLLLGGLSLAMSTVRGA